MYDFLLVFFSNFVSKTHRFFWDIRRIEWAWNPGLGSLKVIENDTIRSGTYHFLLTFHSNHRPISHHFRDKRRFPSIIDNFSHPVYFAPPLKGLSFEWDIGAGVRKTRMMGLPDGRKSFKIGLTVYILYRRVTDRRTDGRVAVAKTALCYASRE